MAEIVIPPTIPGITLPVPSRLNPVPFSERMDRFLVEMPATVDGMNMAVTWTHQTALVVEQHKNAAAQSVTAAAGEVAKATSQANRAKNEADRSATEASNSQASAVSAQIAADLAQQAAGVPADYTGLEGQPLTVNPAGTGTHFADPIFPYKVVTSNYTAKPGEIIAADIRTKNITITLPANPAHRSKVTVFSYARAQSNYVLTIARNGKQLMRLNENMEIDMPFATVKLVYDQTIGWILYE